MSRKNTVLIAAAFLAGVVVTSIVASILNVWPGLSPHSDAGISEASAASGKDIDFAEIFPSWNPDSASLSELVAFVIDTTDEESPGYLEPADRIAVFDMDGTILCEKAPVYIDYCLTMYRVLDDPTYSATPEETSAMREIRDHAYSEGTTFHPDGLTKDDIVALAFAGMTPEEFRSYVVGSPTTRTWWDSKA